MTLTIITLSRELLTVLTRVYNKLWKVFDDIDTGDDNRINFTEFLKGLHLMGMHLNAEEARRIFAQMDSGKYTIAQTHTILTILLPLLVKNILCTGMHDGRGKGGGQVLFEEFCKFCDQMIAASMKQQEGSRQTVNANGGGTMNKNTRRGGKDQDTKNNKKPIFLGRTRVNTEIGKINPQAAFAGRDGFGGFKYSCPEQSDTHCASSPKTSQTQFQTQSHSPLSAESPDQSVFDRLNGHTTYSRKLKRQSVVDCNTGGDNRKQSKHNRKKAPTALMGAHGSAGHQQFASGLRCVP